MRTWKGGRSRESHNVGWVWGREWSEKGRNRQREPGWEHMGRERGGKGKRDTETDREGESWGSAQVSCMLPGHLHLSAAQMVTRYC